MREVWVSVVGVGARYARLTSDERVQIQALWVAGRSVTQIAVQLGRAVSTVSREVRRNGGYVYSGARFRHPRALSVRPGPGRAAVYRRTYNARSAQARAGARVRLRAGRRPGRLADPVLCRLVAGKLALCWSPRQVAGWLGAQYPDRPDWQVSHETIYQALFCQARSQLRAELEHQLRLRQHQQHQQQHQAQDGLAQDGLAQGELVVDLGRPADHRQVLRSGRVARRARPDQVGATASRRGPGGVKRRPWTAGWHISTRPAQAQDRAVPGHWEGDLLIGARNASAIVTLVERSTRYVLLGALPDGRDSPAVIQVLTTLIERLPEHLARSLTWDNGTEMAQVEAFRVATGCPVYFADPRSPWQRGTNENTNGLLRQYYPKGRHDFTTTSQARLDAVAHELNTRPRETLGFRTPAERLAALINNDDQQQTHLH